MPIILHLSVRYLLRNYCSFFDLVYNGLRLNFVPEKSRMKDKWKRIAMIIAIIGIISLVPNYLKSESQFYWGIYYWNSPNLKGFYWRQYLEHPRGVWFSPIPYWFGEGCFCWRYWDYYDCPRRPKNPHLKSLPSRSVW